MLSGARVRGAVCERAFGPERGLAPAEGGESEVQPALKVLQGGEVGEPVAEQAGEKGDGDLLFLRRVEHIPLRSPRALCRAPEFMGAAALGLDLGLHAMEAGLQALGEALRLRAEEASEVGAFSRERELAPANVRPERGRASPRQRRGIPCQVSEPPSKR